MPGCAIYSFSGSALPAYIQTVAIPMFDNKTMEPGIAEEMTRTITQEYITNNRLRVVEKDANATLLVTIIGYANDPFSYDAPGTVREYRVTIRASALFRDEKKGKDIWKEDNIICYGTYAASTENQDTGKRKAMKSLADILIENTISGW